MGSAQHSQPLISPSVEICRAPLVAPVARCLMVTYASPALPDIAPSRRLPELGTGEGSPPRRFAPRAVKGPSCDDDAVVSHGEMMLLLLMMIIYYNDDDHHQ